MSDEVVCNNGLDIQKRIERFSIEHYDEKLNREDYEGQLILMGRVKGLGEDNDEAEEARRKLLLAYVRPVPLTKVSNYILPKRIDDVSWIELVNTFTCVYKPSKPIFAARLDFEKCIREKMSFSTFVLRLKELASYCKYDGNFEERVRDRFAGGVHFPQVGVEIRQRWPEGLKKMVHV